VDMPVGVMTGAFCMRNGTPWRNALISAGRLDWDHVARPSYGLRRNTRFVGTVAEVQFVMAGAGPP